MKIIKIEAEIDEEISTRKKRWNWETISKIVGIVVALIGIWYTAIQYSASEKWKRAEFVVQEVKKFSDSNCIKLIDQTLDYTSTMHYKYIEEYIDINSEILKKALDTTDGVKYTGTVSILRSAFDCYFDNISLFNRYIKSDVMTFKEIKPYLQYYINIIADTANPRIDGEARKMIWSFISKYGFTDVQELCCLYGYNISLNDSINFSCTRKKKFLGIF